MRPNSFEYRTNGIDGLHKTRWALSLFLAATMGITAGVTIAHAHESDPVFLGWPRELASRGPALADGIRRAGDESPDTIAFRGRDTLEVVFMNPTVWRNDMESKAFPMATVPVVEGKAKRVAMYVWSSFGRAAGIGVLKVTYVRMRVQHDLSLTPYVPTHLASGQFSREQLETGDPKFMLAIVLREGGTWEGTAVARNHAGEHLPLTPGTVGSDALAVARGVLQEAIQHDVGDVNTVTVIAPDTVDVHVPIPRFWWKDDTLKALPEESLPVARQTAKHAAEYIWEHHARAAGINVIRIRFRRDWKHLENGAMRQRPAQEVTAQFTRQQFETGQLEPVQLSIRSLLTPEDHKP